MTKYCAPSWSWASITGQVHYNTSPEPIISNTFVILDVHCETNENPFGPASSAYMRVSGLVVPVKPNHKRNPPSLAPTQFGSSKTLRTNLKLDITTTPDPQRCGHLLFLLVAEGIGAPHGLVLRRREEVKPGGATNGDEIFERIGYASTTPAREKAAYSSDEDSDLEWDSESAVQAWTDWAEIGVERVLRVE